MLRAGLSALMIMLMSTVSWAATPWQTIQQPLAGVAQSIGGFSNGCIIGAQALPLKNEYYQVMRQDQRRYFGHPELIKFIQRLSTETHYSGAGQVLIGDLGMAAGGAFSSGHASHQSGLDVDIWLQLPLRRWSDHQLLKPVPLDLVSADGKRVVAERWSPQTGQLIQQAAKDPQVTRIFVHPAIKQQLCKEEGRDRDWLRKVRPWFGHRAHMHVRLGCPVGSAECEDQTPPPEGDGCGAELQSWFKPQQPGSTPVKRQPPPLPASCQVLLDKHLL